MGWWAIRGERPGEVGYLGDVPADILGDTLDNAEMYANKEAQILRAFRQIHREYRKAWSRDASKHEMD